MEKFASSSGARKMGDMNAQRRDEFNAGGVTKNRQAHVMIDCALLMQAAVLPQVTKTTRAMMQSTANMGIVRRMALTGDMHGWACYLRVKLPNLTLAQCLAVVHLLTDDRHHAVHEWRWVALRAHLAAERECAIALLVRWTDEPSPNLCRLAHEALRSYRVWCKHINALKVKPEMSWPLLESLQADTSLYVQDSVANRFDDVSKTQLYWMCLLCQCGLSSPANPVTERICPSALRSVGK